MTSEFPANPRVPHIPLPPHACSVCGVRFAKAAKRDSHLLDVHGATYGVTRSVLQRSTTSSLASLLSAALETANEAFRLLPPSTPTRCGQCTRKFRNPRDYSQHIIRKHSADHFVVPEAAAVSSISVSYNHINNINTMGKKRINNTPAPSAPPRKLIKTEPAASNTNTNANTSCAKSAYGSSSSKVKAETKVRRVSKSKKSAPQVAIAKPTARKPPLSPKPGSSRESSPKLTPSSSSAAAAAPPPPARRDASNKPGRAPMMMDFCTGGGFSPNARKSYYKVVKR